MCADVNQADILAPNDLKKYVYTSAPVGTVNPVAPIEKDRVCYLIIVPPFPYKQVEFTCKRNDGSLGNIPTLKVKKN